VAALARGDDPILEKVVTELAAELKRKQTAKKSEKK
jgi:hypothetical protein